MSEDPKLRHRDAFGRVEVVSTSDATRERYIRPSDGRLVPLLVQSTDHSYGYGATPGQGNWVKTGPPQMRVSAILNLVHWTYSSVLKEGSEERRYTAGSFWALALKWIPSCILLVIMLLVPQDLEGTSKNGGFYDPVRYQDRRYPKVSKNRAEDQHQVCSFDEQGKEHEPLMNGDIELAHLRSQTSAVKNRSSADDEKDEEYDDLPVRHFGPRFLCFLQDGPRGPDTSCITRNVDEWRDEHGVDAEIDFVFLSYTRAQFCVGTEQEIFTVWTLPDIESRVAHAQLAQVDRDTLLEYGMEAARSAGKRAFWVDFECIRDVDNVARAHSHSNDVYRICDIVRAAHSLVVLVGPSVQSKVPRGVPEPYGPESMQAWLQVWGSRLWTLPEILLCPTEHRVKLYAIGGPHPPDELAKRNFAGRAIWRDDARLVRQLVDHYESSIHLTPLELVSLALECLAGRQTEIFSKGDISYALMNLLRRRPAVDQTDSGFEAFARLSLANDSDALLERLICMQPVHPGAQWFEIKDAWKTRLWDIEPRCQVAGIVDDQTVTLDGAMGATIQWGTMDQVAFFKRPTVMRLIGKIILRGVPVYLIIGLAMTIGAGVLGNQTPEPDPRLSEASGQGEGSVNSGLSGASLALLIPGLIFLIPSAIITLLSPIMLLDIYGGKFWSTQALFIGIEGIPENLGDMERHLFGFNYGRFRWSVAGSTLSRHTLTPEGECMALPPKPQSTKQADSAPYGTSDLQHEEEGTLFTLIDTYAMTATAFRAARPPTAVMVCGQEGGMQRAVLCSYDWQRGTFAREAVIRVKTLILDRMFRVDRFRFALQRQTDVTVGAAQKTHDGYGDTVNANPASAHAPPLSTSHAGVSGSGAGYITGGWWKIDLALMPFMWFVHGSIPTGFVGLPILLSSIGFVLAQLVAYEMIPRLQIGHIVAAATFGKGVLGIALSCIDIANQKPAYTAVQMLEVFAGGILVASLIYLTSIWYEAAWGRMLRLVIWMSGGPFWASLANLAARPSYPVNIVAVACGSISVLLSGYALTSIGTPDQATWTSLPAELWLRVVGGRATHERKTTISHLLKKPQTYFFFAASLFAGAFESVMDIPTSMLNIRHPPMPIVAVICPTIVVLAFGIPFTQFRHFRMLIIAIIAGMGFGGWMGMFNIETSESLWSDVEDLSDEMVNGLILLSRLMRLAPILIMCLLLTDLVEPDGFIGSLFITLAGYGVGYILTGIFWVAHFGPRLSLSGYLAAQEGVGLINLVYAVFALLLATLLAWSIQYWLATRRQQKRQQDSVVAAPIPQSIEDTEYLSPSGYVYET